MHMKGWEICLCFFSIFAIIIGGALAITIGFLLPRHETGFYYADYKEYCRCRHLAFDPYNPKTTSTTARSNTTKKELKSNFLEKRECRYRREVVDNINNITEDVTKNTNKFQNSLVSISLPIYNDDTLDTIFHCNGFLLDTKVILTSKYCLQNSTAFLDAIVRHGSQFWSRGGVENRVDRVLEVKNDSGVVVLYLEKDFEVEDGDLMFDLNGAYMVNVTGIKSGVEVGWLNKDGLLKNEVITTQNVKLIQKHQDCIEENENKTKPIGNYGQLLVNEENQAIGLKIQENVFVNLMNTCFRILLDYIDNDVMPNCTLSLKDLYFYSSSS